MPHFRCAVHLMMISHLGAQEAEHVAAGQGHRVQGRLQAHAALVTGAGGPRGDGDPGQQVRHHRVSLAVSGQARPLGILTGQRLLVIVIRVIVIVSVTVDISQVDNTRC